MTKKERYEAVINWFSETMPSPTTELEYDSPFHLLLAVILSAQCTDKRVNMVTPALFEAFPYPEVLADASEEHVYSFIKSVTFPNNKTRHLIRAAKILTEEFNGEMPSDIDNLMKLPGVGRKTANVMLAVVWNRAAMAVDTHVFRVSNRIGLTTDSKTPLETEKTLIKYFPEDIIATAHHWLILHGRYVCKARNPECDNCGLKQYCKEYPKIKKASDNKKVTDKKKVSNKKKVTGKSNNVKK
ncbi:MAG: endonuclease III [Muribaculaceae bacterium]|nr:endonuclease III [Muribaculaceae bacterium]